MDALLAQQLESEDTERSDSMLARELSRKELDAIKQQEEQQFQKLQVNL